MAQNERGPEGCPDETAKQPVAKGSSTEDLARGLFANKNHGLANVVRDLQERSKKAQLNKNSAGTAGADKGPNGIAETAVELSVKDVEDSNGAGLWVVGGASTVLDVKGATCFVEGAGAPAAFGQDDEKAAAAVAPADAVAVAMGGDGKDVWRRPSASGVSSGWFLRSVASYCSSCCTTILQVLKELADIVRLYPSTVIIPLLVFLLLTGLGVWGVLAGARAHVQQQKDDVYGRAVDAATGFQIQLQQSFTPGVTFQLLVRQRPEWSYWVQNFNQTAQELLSRVPNGSLWNLQLQPFGQVMMIYPFRPEDLSQVNPPRDLIGDPTRRAGILSAITSRQPAVNGPFDLVQGFKGAFVRYPIYVPDVSANETFGFRYPQNTTDVPFDQLPASVRNCSVCYNATSREKWWGMLTVLVNYDEVTHGKDAYLANLRNMNLDYALVAPINATSEQIIFSTLQDNSLKGTDAITVPVKVINGVWTLRVAPAGGFGTTWKDPLIAAVVIIAFIISVLLFVTLASFKRQRLLLMETVAANHKLAETTEQLREEKERMDVLLVRQYDLLKCLDANRTKRTDEDSFTGNSRKAMMTRIEDARRSLNVAKASLDDPIQVFEVLGAGAFGKVQRGLWRGTVVAVKTMILPANMTGQEKREKMAVMEAAISSSLVHPNIVTTYTYFIRPYHEPSHGGVQQMPSSTQYTGTSFSQRSNGSDPAASTDNKSVTSEAAIHSYEVRLVLEFCDKGSLKDALNQDVFMQGQSFNLAAMLETAADVAKAMVHMHASNVLHSDLKARNIMLKSSGTEGRGVVAKVADFGLSTRMEHQETHLSSCFQGTLTHMAPEVMLEGRISKAADVYSFGILMWELFCASEPFAGVPRAHLGHAITKEARRPKFPPFAPRDYVALASRCWDPDAALRPSFEEVLAELNRMREEVGGQTSTLQIVPPAAPESSQGGEHLGGGGANSGGGTGGATSGFGAFGENGVITRDNPLALYNAGIVLGGGSTTMAGGSVGAGFGGGTGAGVGGSAVPNGIVIGQGGIGDGSSVGGGTSLPHGANKMGMFKLSSSSSYQRDKIKSSLAYRHLRKLGIRMGNGGSISSGLGPTLSALEEESEHREGSSS